MGHDPDREDPFFFQKNPDNLVTGGGDFPYPPKTNDVHHEIELAVALGKGGKDLPLEKAPDHVWGYGVALDLTRRDLPGHAQMIGRPRETDQAYEPSDPCSAQGTVSAKSHTPPGH